MGRLREFVLPPFLSRAAENRISNVDVQFWTRLERSGGPSIRIALDETEISDANVSMIWIY